MDISENRETESEPEVTEAQTLEQTDKNVPPAAERWILTPKRARFFAHTAAILSKSKRRTARRRVRRSFHSMKRSIPKLRLGLGKTRGHL